MIFKISNFLFEDEDVETSKPENDSMDGGDDHSEKSSSGKSKLKINWVEPDLAEEIHHYTNAVKQEFYQHNIEISNNDLSKTKAPSTKFYKYISQPFKRGKMMELPLYSEDEFQVTKIQNLDSYEYENIVAGAYGKGYGEVTKKVADDLKSKGKLSLPAPIIIRFINFGETRRNGEASYFLFSGNRRINLALYYGIPIEVWVVDLIPSRRDVRDFAERSGILSKGQEFFKEFLTKRTGKDNLDSLTARERFNVIQSLKSF